MRNSARLVKATTGLRPVEDAELVAGAGDGDILLVDDRMKHDRLIQ